MSDDAKVLLYTAPNCDTSDRARADLVAEGIEFEERDVMKDKQWYKDVLARTIFVPLVVWPDGRFEIGWKGRVG